MPITPLRCAVPRRSLHTRSTQQLLLLLLLLLSCSTAAKTTKTPRLRVPEGLLSVSHLGGQGVAHAAREIRAGETVFAVSLSDVITADSAAASLLSEDSAGEDAHRAAAALAKATQHGWTLRNKGAAATTPYTPPHLLQKDERVADYALLHATALRLESEWGPLYGEPPSPYTGGTDSPPGFRLSRADQLPHPLPSLLGLFSEEHRITEGQCGRAVSLRRALQDGGYAGVLPSEGSLCGAARLLRVRGVASPYGEMVGEFGFYFRQAHAGCAGGRVEIQEAKLGDEPFIVGVAPSGIPVGEEICIGYTDAGVSRQEILTRYGIDDKLSPTGAHYSIPETDRDCPHLARHGCEVGELLLDADGTLSEKSFFCYLLHQIPPSVRHDYKNLIYTREARAEGASQFASALKRLLETSYGTALTPAEADAMEDGSVSLLTAEDLTEIEARAGVEQDDKQSDAGAGSGEPVGGGGGGGGDDDDDFVAFLKELQEASGSDDDVPEGLQDVLRKAEEEAVAGRRAADAQGSEVQQAAVAEGEAEGVTAVPEPSRALAGAAAQLRALYNTLAHRVQFAEKQKAVKELHRIRAESEALREETRLRLEELELGRLIAKEEEEKGEDGG